MRTRAMAGGAALLIAALAGCGSGGHTDGKATAKPSRPPATTATASAPSTHLAFGQGYTWPDGLRVSVIGAQVFTDYADGESAQPGFTDFRIMLRVANGGRAPADLGGLSIVVQGATTGGTAQSATFANGSEPLEGQLAPGAVAFKNDDESLATTYGRRIVVRVQRVAEDPSGQTWPEFTGAVGG